MTYWDTLTIGQIREMGAHRFEAEAIIAFARQYDPQPFHLDATIAERSTLGGLCASGWHITAVMMKLLVASRTRDVEAFTADGASPPRIGPSPGVKNIRWLKPVMAGDTLAYRSTITAKRVSESRPGWGLVESTTEAFNQRGEKAFSMEAAAFVGTD